MSKLNATANAIGNYFCSDENYYYKQSDNIQQMLKKSGFQVSDLATLEHVRLYGKVAEKLGHKSGQAISQNVFENLLNCKNAAGLKVSREHKNKGIDITFSAPKSVSIAALVSNNITREYQRKIIEAHNEAVSETMRMIEEKYSYAHPRADQDVKSTGMCWAQVNDGFNREHDPHLHTHAVVFNLTEYQGKFMSLRPRELFQHEVNQFCGAYYRQTLAGKIKKLDLSVSYLKGGEFRLNLITGEQEKEFSTRHNQITKAKSNGAGDQEAWRKTRKEKEPTIDKAKMTANWDMRFNKYYNQSQKTNKDESEAERKQWSKEAEFSIEAEHERNYDRVHLTESERWQLAAERATQQTATPKKESIMREYMNEVMRTERGESLSIKELDDRFGRQLEKGYILKVKSGYTTIDYALSELDYMRRLNEKTFTPATDKKAAEKFLSNYNKEQRHQNNRQLSEIQLTAVGGMLQDDKMIIAVQGDAGAGKTTALRAAADFYKEKGIEVVGLTMQGVAAKNLEAETGIKSTTLRSFLANRQRISNAVYIVDEASMLDTRTAQKLFERAKSTNSKVILVGDINQLESIGAGKVFQRTVELRERENKLIKLNENFRQRDKELQQAAGFARQGKMKDCHAILEKKNCITEIKNKMTKKEDRDSERKQAIVKEYNKDTLIITGSTASREKLNLQIREKLKNDGELKNEKIYKISKIEKDGTKTTIDRAIAKNEIIQFTKNDYKEYDIRNGERAKVIDTKDNELKVKTEDGRNLSIDLNKYNTIDYGYAMTTHKAQGQTYDKVVIEAETNYKTLNDMRSQYVNITRARDSVKIYTDDKEELKELNQIKTEKSDTLEEKLDERELMKINRAYITETTSEKISGLQEQEKDQDQVKKLGKIWGLEL
jgi:conjugative relaxase-like TrwC/TraI family protein